MKSWEKPGEEADATQEAEGYHYPCIGATPKQQLHMTRWRTQTPPLAQAGVGRGF